MSDQVETRTPNQPFRSSFLNGYEIQKACQEQLLTIDPFSSNHLTASGYRLSCGDEALLDGHLLNLTRERPLELKREKLAILSTREILSMPHWLTGKLNQQAATLRLGLFTDLPGSIDPGFRGRLFVAVQNRGPRSIAVAPGVPLVTLELCLLNVPPEWPSQEKYVSLHGPL
jgi:deoxycytidine triphosphate deaminase